MLELLLKGSKCFFLQVIHQIFFQQTVSLASVIISLFASLHFYVDKRNFKTILGLR